PHGPRAVPPARWRTGAAGGGPAPRPPRTPRAGRRGTGRTVRRGAASWPGSGSCPTAGRSAPRSASSRCWRGPRTRRCRTRHWLLSRRTVSWRSPPRGAGRCPAELRGLLAGVGAHLGELPRRRGGLGDVDRREVGEGRLLALRHLLLARLVDGGDGGGERTGNLREDGHHLGVGVAGELPQPLLERVDLGVRPGVDHLAGLEGHAGRLGALGERRPGPLEEALARGDLLAVALGGVGGPLEGLLVVRAAARSQGEEQGGGQCGGSASHATRLRARPTARAPGRGGATA